MVVGGEEPIEEAWVGVVEMVAEVVPQEEVVGVPLEEVVLPKEEVVLPQEEVVLPQEEVVVVHPEEEMLEP